MIRGEFLGSRSIEDSQCVLVTGNSIVLWTRFKGFDSLNLRKSHVSNWRDGGAPRGSEMRYILTVDFEDDIDIESFMHFVAYHTKRLKCASKDVFIRLAHEWEKQLVNPHEPRNPKGVKKEKKKTIKETNEKQIQDTRSLKVPLVPV